MFIYLSIRFIISVFGEHLHSQIHHIQFVLPGGLHEFVGHALTDKHHVIVGVFLVEKVLTGEISIDPVELL